jgi:CDP-glucose 4,6-dehydratase
MVKDFQFFKDKTVLITGDTGFKGSWLAFWLQKIGANVIGYSLPPKNKFDHYNLIGLDQKITHIDGNILDYDKLISVFNQYKPEIIFHLAAQALVRLSYDKPQLTFETNVMGSVNVLEAIKNCSSVKSVIYVTTDKCYKNNEWVWGYRETDTLGGHDPYSASKAAAEIIFSSYSDSFFAQKKNIGLASVRAGNVIGGGDWALDRIIPDCIRALSNNSPIAIRNPNSTRPWQHVLEPLSGYMALAIRLYKNPKEFGGVWNFGPPINSIKSVQELALEVVKVYGKGETKVIDEGNKHESSILHLNCDKANALLNWMPTWGFSETIKYTVNWYKDFEKRIDPETITSQNIDNYIKSNLND